METTPTCIHVCKEQSPLFPFFVGKSRDERELKALERERKKMTKIGRLKFPKDFFSLREKGKLLSFVTKTTLRTFLPSSVIVIFLLSLFASITLHFPEEEEICEFGMV